MKGAGVNTFRRSSSSSSKSGEGEEGRRSSGPARPKRGYRTQPAETSSSSQERSAFARSAFDDIADYIRQRERVSLDDEVDENQYLSTRMKREKVTMLRRLVNRLEKEMGSDSVDWGEVTDARRIQSRVKQLAALNMLRQELSDLGMKATALSYCRVLITMISFAEYEVEAEEEEEQFMRSIGQEDSSYSANYFDQQEGGGGFDPYTSINSRSPWRQHVERQRRSTRRYGHHDWGGTVGTLDTVRQDDAWMTFPCKQSHFVISWLFR